jgi:hypothetical protein
MRGSQRGFLHFFAGMKILSLNRFDGKLGPQIPSSAHRWGATASASN